jgi:hypothetical protein
MYLRKLARDIAERRRGLSLDRRCRSLATPTAPRRRAELVEFAMHREMARLRRRQVQ